MGKTGKKRQPPGTVSKILWHFTGGPRWNAKKKKQYKRRKPPEEAYDNLKSILKGCELRVGQYVEVVKLLRPEPEFGTEPPYDLVGVQDVPRELTSARVCCLSDIPIVHLAYHAEKYGQFAIGFHREAVLRNGFNPVFYTLETTKLIQSVWQGFESLRSVDISLIRSVVESLVSDGKAGEADPSIFDFEVLQIGEDIRQAEEAFKRFLAFVKTFQQDEFDSIYCEREWRSVHRYEFTYKESVAMIVLPRKAGGREYFTEFVSEDAEAIGLPRSIPVVPWEDLVEH